MAFIPQTLKAKLFTSAIVAIILVLGAVSVTWIYQGSITRVFTELGQRDAPLQRNVQLMSIEGLLSATALRNRIIFGEHTKGPWKKVAENGINTFDKALSIIENKAKLMPSLLVKIKEIKRLWHKDRDDRLKMIQLLSEQKRSQALKVLTQQAQPRWFKIRVDLDKLRHEITQIQAQDRLDAQNILKQSGFWSTTLLILAILIGGGLTGLAIITMVKRVNMAIQTMNDIAHGEGDLTSRMPDKKRDELDQLGGAFNQFAERIQQLVLQVMGSTSQLASAAEELSTTSEESSERVRQQRLETEQVATAMNEMSSTVHEVARNANDAAEAAQQADNNSRHGREIVTETVKSIEVLSDEVEHVAEAILKLEGDSTEINRVLEVISGISEQTNLLALNAAIEAARAGEHGRGFAVVADEVRTLAKQTQSSTEEIRGMIERLQSGAKNAVDAMETGRERAGNSVNKAREADTSLESINQSIGRINDMNALIASAAEEQSSVAEEINRNITNINRVAEETFEGSKQTSTASEDLARLSSELQTLISQFKVS